MPQHILVLGATGPSGIDFCNSALREGHQLTIYVRNPSKLPDSIAGSPSVAVIEGLMTDKAGLEKAASCGATALASFLGPIIGKVNPETELTPGYKLLVPLLEAHGIDRALILSTPSYNSPDDNGGVKWLVIFLVKWFFPKEYADVISTASFFESIPLKSLKWTIFRVPVLKSGEAGPAVALMKGESRDGLTRWGLDRKTLAEWVLAEINAEKWVGKAPIIFNA